VGHLGIFVSAGIARKEHQEFSSNIDLIDTLPPGLYEAVLENKTPDTANPDLAGGQWVMRCEARTLDDIRALGGNDTADNRCFEAAARLSERNLAMYRAFAQPFVRAFATVPVADWLQKSHPLRLQYEWFSDSNPLLAPLSQAANWVSEHRKAAGADNPMVAMEHKFSDGMIAALDGWRDARDAWAEKMFFAVYGSPVVQAALGVQTANGRTGQQAPKNALHKELIRSRIAELKARIPVGGIREAVTRALLYVGMSRPAVDERGFEAIRRIRQAQEDMPALPLPQFKAMVREQFYMLLIDEDAALAAIPAMLPADMDIRRKGVALIKNVLSASGQFTDTDKQRLERVAGLFKVELDSDPFRKIAAVSSVREFEKAS
jgi:hypothetical protein